MTPASTNGQCHRGRQRQRWWGGGRQRFEPKYAAHQSILAQKNGQRSPATVERTSSSWPLSDADSLKSPMVDAGLVGGRGRGGGGRGGPQGGVGRGLCA
jgi:hypothetical protein